MGSLSPNEIRGLDDEDPIDGGDRYYVQQNLMPVDKMDEILAAKNAPARPALSPGDPGASEDEVEAKGDDLRSFLPILRDLAARMLHREITAAKRAAKKQDWVAFRVWIDEYYAEAVGTTALQIVPLATSMAQAAGCVGAHTAELIRNYAVAAAQAMVNDSTTALREALRVGPPDELDQVIEALLESWRWSRPDAIAEREVTRAAEIFTVKQLESAA
jgi:hypothetical protein